MEWLTPELVTAILAGLTGLVTALAGAWVMLRPLKRQIDETHALVNGQSEELKQIKLQLAASQAESAHLRGQKEGAKEEQERVEVEAVAAAGGNGGHDTEANVSAAKLHVEAANTQKEASAEQKEASIIQDHAAQANAAGARSVAETAASQAIEGGNKGE